MKTYRYNENIKCLEIEPAHIAKGLAHAKSIGVPHVRLIHLDYCSEPKLHLDFAPFEGQRRVFCGWSNLRCRRPPGSAAQGPIPDSVSTVTWVTAA